MRDRPSVFSSGGICQDHESRASRKSLFSGKKETKWTSPFFHKTHSQHKSENMFSFLFPRCNSFKRSEIPVKISGNQKAQINALILSPLLFINRFFMNFLISFVALSYPEILFTIKISSFIPSEYPYLKLSYHPVTGFKNTF